MNSLAHTFRPFARPNFQTLLLMLSLIAHGVVGAEAPASEPVAQPYVWRSVEIGGGGFVTGIVAHPRQKDLVYARTDVGGAYRWDGAVGRWIPLNDWTGEADWNLMGIESLAVDPSDPRRLYLAAGTYSRIAAAMLRSDDQGRSFQRTNVPFGMGGNESGRFAGERLAVDPNDGAILFFGSRRDGLWRSADHGATWVRVQSFPAIATAEAANAKSNAAGLAHPPPAVGIVAVAFDASTGQQGRPTLVIYAAVSTTDLSLYRSTDAGETWNPVENQPVGLRPNHLVCSPHGTLFLSYSREPGPGQVTDGAVWRYGSASAGAMGGPEWTDITPERPAVVNQPFGYGCVAIDPREPSTILVTTFTHWRPHDQIYRSVDEGVTWHSLWKDDAVTWDHSTAPYTASRGPHWLGTVVIDPFDSDRVTFTTGYGIWASRNAAESDPAKPIRWDFCDAGLEETVPLALVSPPIGAHLISGLGDIDGFRHDDLASSPAGGSFAGPRFSSTRDVAFAATHPEIMARIGNAGRGVFVHVAMSSDGGRTWQSLAKDIPDGDDGLGRVALSADGGTLLWLGSRGRAFVTSDRGVTWTRCEGVESAASVAGDPVDGTFYTFSPRTGKLHVSVDGGRHFAEAPGVVPGAASNDRSDVLAVMPGRSGDVWAGARSVGLFHSTDGGESFARIGAVAAADAMGFGRAAPGSDNPALFLRGRIGSLQAFFRSDDNGATWIRINDDDHQYGGANRPIIIGDPRIYGRAYLSTSGRGIIYGDIRR